MWIGSCHVVLVGPMRSGKTPIGKLCEARRDETVVARFVVHPGRRSDDAVGDEIAELVQ